MLKKRFNAILAHIWCNRNCIKLHGLKKSLCILRRSVADITSLGICYFKMLIRNVSCRSLHCLTPFCAIRFVKSRIDLIAYTMVFCAVNYLPVELKKRIGMLLQVCRYFFQVGVEAHTEVRAFCKYLFSKLLA